MDHSDRTSSPDPDRRSRDAPAPQDERPGALGTPGRPWLWVALLLLGIAAFWPMLSRSTLGASEISYTKFRKELIAGNVERVKVQDRRITGKVGEPLALGEGEEKRDVTTFTTRVPEFGDDRLTELLAEHDVPTEVEASESTGFLPMLIGFLPFLLLIGLMFFAFRAMRSRSGGGAPSPFNIGKSKAKTYTKESVDTRFDDVAGVEGAKADLEETVRYLKAPGDFTKLGGKPPRGILLVGAPGTGKTLLARAVAGEANVPFFSASGSQFMEMFVGVGASRVRNMFEEARKAAPSIIFIDELDSIGRQRGAGVGGGHDEREQTLNQLLTEMDGFEAHEGVIVMAATNRPDILDPALQRPGRFDRRVAVELPTKKSRRAILDIHARGKKFADDVNLDKLAGSTPGFSGADLENILNEAAIIATSANKEAIGPEDIDGARDRVILGRRREDLMLTDEEIETFAYHEGGHAVVASALEHTDPVQKVSVVPRGRAMGVTHQVPERDRFIENRETLMDRIAVMMGGRAAEEVVLGTATSGAADDLQRATQLARKMVLEMGMGEGLGKMAFGNGHEKVFLGHELGEKRDYGEETAKSIDSAVRAILDEAWDSAKRTLETHRHALDQLAKELTEEEEISGQRVGELLEESRVKRAS